MPIPALAAVAGVSALANIGASIYGTRAQTNAAKKARALYKPYAQAGARGLAQYEQLLQNPASVQQTPGYDFRLQEGQKALERSAAARGMSQSGAHAKALMRYGQGFASQEYDRALGRAGGLAQYGAQGIGGVANAEQQIGQARASGYVGAANALRGGLQDYAFSNRLQQLNQSGYAQNPYGQNPYQ